MLIDAMDDAFAACFGRVFPLVGGPRPYVRQVAVFMGCAIAFVPGDGGIPPVLRALMGAFMIGIFTWLARPTARTPSERIAKPIRLIVAIFGPVGALGALVDLLLGGDVPGNVVAIFASSLMAPIFYALSEQDRDARL